MALTKVRTGGLDGILTEVDEFRVTANDAGGSSVITDWERNDTNFDKIGTGMSVSSGIFTFPSTGKYSVDFNAYVDSNDFSARVEDIFIEKTTNNSSYSRAATMSISLFDSNSFTHSGGTVGVIIDVTDVSNIKVRFGTNFQDNAVRLRGDTDTNNSFVRFLKLGST